MNIPPEPPADAWLSRFWHAFYARRPVEATFVGRDGHDHELPHLGEAGIEETLSEMRQLLAEARAGGRSAVERSVVERSAVVALDRGLAEGFLEIQIREHESRHLLRNPSVHTGEAVFGLMSLFLPNRPPTTTRVEALRSRIQAIPDFLDRSRSVLTSAPDAWIRRAAKECRGGVAFLRRGVAQLGVDHLGVDLGEAPEVAAAALEGFAAFLDGALPRADDAVACGPETFELYLKKGHLLDRSADEIADRAREEMAEARSWLDAKASSVGAASPEEALARLADAHPGPESYYDRYREIWTAMRAIAEEQDLVTWPEFPIRYVPRPAWAREAAPDLYFLFYRSPAAFDRPEIHDYLVAPLDPSRSAAEQESFLRANNDSVIKLNHVVHHGGIGHHVQNWHAFRSPFSVGRVAAVDGASRIAMFCGGTMAEGWACYATDVMAEAGAFTELERYAERHGRVRMCARAIVDVELHHGRMSLTEAARFYRDNAGMTPGAAEAEAVKNSMFPATALMYLVGTDAIHELRDDLVRETRGRLTLREFHDSFLSYGSIPVAVTAAEMKRKAALGLPLGAHDHDFERRDQP